jgi:site-specific DNA recombinase
MGRRQWRRNPVSEKRERRYRLRDRNEWIEVEVPDLRIIPDDLWEAVQNEMQRRARGSGAKGPAGKPRKKHLLSGQIKCSTCGSNYTISGKDYYRCAGHKERGTCGNTLSVRKGALEKAALSILQHHLFTEAHAKLFTETFNRQVQKLAGNHVDRNQALKDRLAVLDAEIGNLSANLLRGVVSSTLAQMLGQREAEKTDIEIRLARTALDAPTAQILPHPELVRRFTQKVGVLRDTLDEETIRTEASELMDRLIESVTIYPDGVDGPEAEMVANVADSAVWATNDNAALRGGAMSSMAVVAGVGFEPTTFRL